MAATWKTVRVFISSTFRDMHAERDHLVRVVFPELRERCAKRHLHLVDVDLRWGVTEEDAQRGKALEICLREIEDCRPFFVGLLGERYGWIPPRYDIPDEEKFDTLRNIEPGHSITAMEIYHGVLNNPQMRTHAFFYFRDPAFIDALSPEKQPDFRAENDEHAEKLRKLKDRIRASGLPVRENYRYDDLDVWGQQVLKDLWEAIQAEYEDIPEPDSLDAERAYHDFFIETRTELFIGQRHLLARLHEFASGDTPGPMVASGTPGCGKSGLLARFASQFRRLEPDTFVLYHFVGASPGSTDPRQMLRRLCGELARRFGIEEEIPQDYTELCVKFWQFCQRAAEQSRVVLVLDALNQLDETHRSHDLDWLPALVPPRLRVVLSSLEGDTLVAARRKYPQRQDMIVTSLRLVDQGFIIARQLQQARKRLTTARKYRRWREVRVARGQEVPPEADRSQLRYILTGVYSRRQTPTPEQTIQRETANPLFLKLVAEELRLFGNYDRLPEFIAQLPIDVPGMFRAVLDRLERDNGREVVERALSLIATGRHGLLEGEILELLARPGEARFPMALWSRLYRGLASYLKPRASVGGGDEGLIDFFHRQLAKVVRERYVRHGESQRACHVELANYFNCKADPGSDACWALGSPRGIAELPYHQTRGMLWPQLEGVLCDPHFIEAKASMPGLGIDAVLEDTALAAAASRVDAGMNGECGSENCFQTLHEQLWSEASVLRREPKLTVQQMANRFLWLSESDESFRRRGQKAVTRLLAEGRDFFRALMPPWLAAWETQGVQILRQEVDAAAMTERSLVLWCRSGGWEAIDELGNSVAEGAGPSVPVQQIVADHHTLVAASGQVIRYWRSWPTGCSSVFWNPWPIRCMSLGNDGQSLLVVGELGEWCRYGVREGSLAEEWRGKIGMPAACCAFSHSGGLCLIGTMNGRIFHCTASGNEPLSLGHGMVRTVAVSPDERLIASGTQEGIVQVRQLHGETIREVDCGSWVNDVTFGRTGDQVLAATEAGHVISIRVNHSATKPLTWLMGSTPLVWLGVFSRDDVVVALGSDRRVRLIRPPSSVATASPRLPLSGRVVSAASVAAGQEVLVVDSMGQRCLIKVGTDACEVVRVSGEAGSVVAAPLTGSGGLLTVYSDLGKTRVTHRQLSDESACEHVIWPGSMSRSRPEPTLHVMDAASSPDGRLMLLVTQHFKGFFRRVLTTALEVYHTDPWKRLFSVPVKQDGGRGAIADDGAFVIYGLRSASRPTLICRSSRSFDFLELPMNGFLGAAFSGAGDGLLVIDGQSQAWFSSQPRRVDQYQVLGSRVASASVSPDGRFVLLAHNDGRACVLRVPVQPSETFASLGRIAVSWCPSYCQIEPCLRRILVGGARSIQVFQWELATSGLSGGSPKGGVRS